MWSSSARKFLDFYCFLQKFGTYLERERIDPRQNFFNFDIVLKLTTGS